MKKNIILALITVLLTGIYIGYDFYTQEKSLKPDTSYSFKLNELDIPDIKKFIEKVEEDNDGVKVLSNWELWRYLPPKVKEEKKEGETKEYPVYEVIKRGIREAIINPTDRNDVWEFYGVFIVNKKPFAIFVNPRNKTQKYRVVTVGDSINKNLKIVKITKSKIVVQFPVSEKEKKNLELKVFYVDLEQFKKKIQKELKK